MDTNNLNNIPYDLIISDLDGSISEVDQRKLHNWRSLSRENDDIYDSISLVFQEIELLPEYQKLDSEISWRSFRQKLETAVKEPVSHQMKPRSNHIQNLKLYISVAATILLIVWISVRFFRADDTVRITTGVSGNKKISMPDGSEVLLNAGTEISYSRRHFGQERVINLQRGEAYFDVVHDDKNPFRINVSHFEIRDIGTSFNVRCKEKSVYITVSSGIVSLSNKLNNQAVTLTANQKGVCNIDSAKIVSFQNDEMNYKAWADHNFQFINCTTSAIIKKLSDVYRVRIVLDDDTPGNKKLTLAFHNQSIGSVMDIIGQTLQLKIEKKGDVFYLKQESH